MFGLILNRYVHLKFHIIQKSQYMRNQPQLDTLSCKHGHPTGQNGAAQFLARVRAEVARLLQVAHDKTIVG